HAQFPLRRHPHLLVDHRRAGSASVADSRGANGVSFQQLRWPASFRNGGRHQIGMVADIKSESVAGLRRNSHNKGYRRFLMKPDDGHFAIDRAKAEEDAKFDGVFVLRTNARLSPLEAMLVYKQLWTVERAFRT